MDTKVADAVVTVENLGNLSPLTVKFVTEKPEKLLNDGARRESYLRFKTDKKLGTKRANMVVNVPTWDVDTMTSKSEHEMMQALFDSHHDSVVLRCADGEITLDEMESREWIVKDFFDTSRDSSGRKVTKEVIGKFYDDLIAPVVVLRAVAKNAQAKEETIQNIVNGYKGMFEQFTKYQLGNAFTDKQFGLLSELFTEAKAKATEEQGSMVEWFEGRIKKVLEAKQAVASFEDAI